MPLLVGVAAFPASAAREAGDFARLLGSLDPRASQPEVERLAAELARLPGAERSWIETSSAGVLAPAGLAAHQRELLCATASLLDRRAVAACVEDGLATAPDTAWRCAALELLREHATAAELPLLVRLAREAGPDPAAADALLGALRGTLVDVLRRDMRAFLDLARIADGDELLRETLVRAVGIAGEAEGLPWLAEQLDRPELAATVLREIARLAPALSEVHAAETAGLVLPLLRAPDPGLRRQAMHALGELRDASAIPRLIRILGRAQGSEREAAHAALLRLSRRELPDRPEVWAAWFEEQRRWFHEEAPATLARLDSAHEADVVAALRELSGRGIHRDRVAVELARLLRDHASPVVRGQACLGLARLGSTAALDELLLALDDPDRALRGNAWTALRTITGRDLPLDVAAWSEALRPPR